MKYIPFSQTGTPEPPDGAVFEMIWECSERCQHCGQKAQPDRAKFTFTNIQTWWGCDVPPPIAEDVVGCDYGFFDADNLFLPVPWDQSRPDAVWHWVVEADDERLR